MNFKRYVEVSDIWVDSHYIMGTSTDTITTLPAVLYPNATTATVGLKGQAVQSSVPSPTSPVMPQGCGNKTANLCPETSFNKTTELYHTITFVEPLPVGTYTISANITPDTGISSARLSFRKSDLSQEVATNITIQTGRSTVTITISNPCSAIYFYGGTTVMDNIPIKYDDIMLNTGSTALPYEPYGVKIPILSADTTSNVYLGEAETTRQIQKLVLTGNESWYVNESVSTDDTLYLYSTVLSGGSFIEGIGVCSHFEYKNVYFITDVTGFHILSGYGGLRIRVMRTTATTANEFKSYLAAQYAAGTPVCVWYVLSSATTGIVNEPLMRIGDYADTLSNVSIPVTAGGDTLSVGTTVQPSEVTFNYKGWHPVADVHEHKNGQWD